MIMAKLGNFIASERKIQKLVISCHYWFGRHWRWPRVMRLDHKAKFTAIYRHNLWNNEESRSGGGSTLKRTKRIRKGIVDLVQRFGVRSILDAGCGDFNWMQAVHLSGVQYIGMDIVREMIEQNRERHGSATRIFLEGDILHDTLPTVDVILCREVLFHLSDADLLKALQNFKRSSARYLLTTHYPNAVNRDIPTGKCRALNFTAAPFVFGAPLEVITEDVDDHGLALWKLEDMNLNGLAAALAKRERCYVPSLNKVANA